MEVVCVINCCLGVGSVALRNGLYLVSGIESFWGFGSYSLTTLVFPYRWLLTISVFSGGRYTLIYNL